MLSSENWQSYTWHCVNCASVVTGHKNAKDQVKVMCKTCQTVMIKTLLGRRHYRVDVYVAKQK